MQADGALPSAPAAERNFRPLLGVLKREFSDANCVLEIGAGTGQHAAGFAREMPWLRWQATDRRDKLAAIRCWQLAADLTNLPQPVALDVGVDEPPGKHFDAAFSANTAHILSEPLVRRMFETIATALVEGARFCLYGPFRESGRFDTDSNARFDAHLKASSAEMGIRDIETLDEFGRGPGLKRIRRYAMPGNNQLLVYERTPVKEAMPS